MKFLEKLDRLMQQRGLNKHTLAQQSGIPYTTIMGLYERGAEKARLSTLNSLCDFFNVPLDYLAVDKYENPEDFVPGERMSSITTDDMNEIQLIRSFRALNAAGKSAALSAVEGLAGNPDFRQEESGTVTA